ncbi:MAG: CsgG/HfaB family protein [bacterium]|nr:CsgG/HfaB family protein [bacterium]
MVKKYARSFLVIFLAVALFGCVPATTVKEEQTISVKPTEEVKSEYTGPKRKVAVIEFENKTTYGARRLGTSASDILITELTKTGKFIMAEREKLNKLLQEQKLGQEQKLDMSGIVDANTAAAAGRILGLDAIITGSISQFGTKTIGSDFLITESKQQVAEATVDIRVVDVSTGQIIYADSGKGTSAQKTSSFLGMGSRASYAENIEGDALRAAIVKFVKNIISQVNKRPWSCRVAEASEGEIYLDAGQESGLKIGTILTVYELGKEIRSPATGMVIGQRQSKCGKIEVVDYFGENGSIAILIEGTFPAPGSLCKMIP